MDWIRWVQSLMQLLEIKYGFSLGLKVQSDFVLTLRLLILVYNQICPSLLSGRQKWLMVYLDFCFGLQWPVAKLL